MKLVTGGTGLVGSAINADIKLYSRDVDIKDCESTLIFFEYVEIYSDDLDIIVFILKLLE